MMADECKDCGKGHWEVCENIRLIKNYIAKQEQAKLRKNEMSVNAIIQIACTVIMAAVTIYVALRGVHP